MGSVVKSIGKVFKKIGKGLKKIAPILLVAAAAYVGYGYATGWQGAGWPRITEWGRSLMGGVRGGSTLSESAIQASESFSGSEAYADPSVLADANPYQAETFPLSGPGSVAGTPLDVTTTPPLPGTETIESPLDAFGGPGPDVSNTTYLGSSVEPFNPITTQSGGLLGGSQPGFLESIGNTLVSPAGADTPSGSFAGQQLYSGPGSQPDVATDLFMPEGVETGTLGGGGWGDQVLSTDADPSALADVEAASNPFNYADFTGEDALLANTTGYQTPDGLWNTVVAALKDVVPTELMGSAWGFYKDLWKSDPLVALYGTQKVAEMILTFLDKSEEEKSYQDRHVGGMPPRSMADVMKTHQKAKASGLRHNKTGIWAQSARPSAGMQGPVNPVRVSAINKQPPGLLGRNPQRALA